MAWKIKANWFEACNCALGCPCNMSGFPTHGFCEGTVAFEVTAGDRDGVDLTGAKVAAAAKWPGAIHEGNGELIVFIDATDEQKEALGPILMAEDPGLPWEILAATLTTVHGPFFEPVSITDNGTDSKISVGSKLEITMTSFKNPVTGDPHEVHTVLPDGFIFTDGKIATTAVNRVDADGVAFDHAGNNAYYANVEWSSENRLAPTQAAGRF